MVSESCPCGGAGEPHSLSVSKSVELNLRESKITYVWGGVGTCCGGRVIWGDVGTYGCDHIVWSDVACVCGGVDTYGGVRVAHLGWCE